MRLLARIRNSLGIKLFLSYLVVVLVGVVVLTGAVQVQTPVAIQRHVERMQSHLLTDPGLIEDLRVNFRGAINEVTLTAAVMALLTAVGVSVFTARRIITPIQALMRASREIAAGHFDQRLPVTGQDELGELARSFNQMASELARTEQRRVQLIGDVAHELRTPLTNMRAVIEGLADGILPANMETYQSVQKEIMRLQRLVQDLQELSRMEADAMSLRPQALDPEELIKNACERLRLQFRDKGVRLEMEVPANLPRVWADPARIMQVLLNLLGNALQYTPRGGRVSVRAEREGRHVRFVVADTGIGVPASDLPHLFERFYRVDKSRSRAGGGSGIGLTISKHIVEAHGGRIRAESGGVGRGSTFTFTLPMAR
ncbi:MAG: HAMP domain-containing protein [Chloroflexi bacterium]|nr:MAG: HAMP domain-containing protein [Chloroflexota bacterium]